MNCIFTLQSEHDGRAIYQCQRCGLVTKPTRSPAHKVHAECRIPGKPSEPVGDELKSLLASWGITAAGDCQCEAHVRQMNAWGLAGCRAHRGVIVGWLIEEAKKRGWAAQVAAQVASGSLVDEAIRRAEAKLAPPRKPSIWDQYAVDCR